MLALSSTSLTHLLPYPLGSEISIDELIGQFLIKGNAVELGSTAKPGRVERYEVDNSTALKIDLDFLAREALFLLDAAKESDLGDDYETRFYDRLQLFVARYQKQAIEALTASIVSRRGSSFALSKTLEAMGAIDDPGTVTDRFWLLQRGVRSSSTIVRYGAALGFGSLRDSRAIQMLEQAAEIEPNSEVRTVLFRVISYLKTSR